MKLTRRTALAGLAAGLAGSALVAQRPGFAEGAPTMRIGILQDASGPNAPGVVACAKLAAKEINQAKGLRVEFLTGDHQNLPETGLGLARAWLDDGVDAVLGFGNSEVALAVNALVRDRDRVLLATNVGAASLHGANCTPNATHWSFDTDMLARSLGTAVYDGGGDSWFFIRADNGPGKAMRDDTAAIVAKKGGKVLGEAALPPGTIDFAPALKLAQASGAKIVALALGGNDQIASLKQARDAGLMTGTQTFASLMIDLQDIHTLGLATAKGLLTPGSFYWNLNDRTRAFTRHVIGTMGGKPPNMVQAGAYCAVTHYLKAVVDLGPAAARVSGRATVARMKQMPVQDDVLTNASIRNDGRVVSDVHLFEVNSPEASKSEWDLLALKATLPPEQAWGPEAEGGCDLANI